MKFVGIVLRVNTHRLTESDFRSHVMISKFRPWRHFTQETAVLPHIVKRLPLAYTATPVSSWSVVHSHLLIFVTYLYAILNMRRMVYIY